MSNTKEPSIGSTVSVLKSYFKKELPNLKKVYNWKIPNIDGFSECGKASYDANVNLKKFLHQKWLTCCGNQDKLDLATVIIKDWGGVKNNKQQTLEEYIKELEKKNPLTPLKGVASYSKLFSITNLDQFAIYDARVAACLNAIQFNSNTQDGVAFSYIPGRNSVTGDATKRIGFAYKERFKLKNLIEKNGWIKLNKDETYSFYISVLKKCLDSFDEYKLYDLEMILFSNAEIECKKALDKIN